MCWNGRELLGSNKSIRTFFVVLIVSDSEIDNHDLQVILTVQFDEYICRLNIPVNNWTIVHFLQG